MPAPTTVDQTVTTSCGQKFKTISKHRGGTGGGISKWTIGICEEYDSFKNALRASIYGTNHAEYSKLDLCWGVHISHNLLSKLGENSNNSNIKFAKFTKHQNNKEWHGYPADYQYKPQDIPSRHFLAELKKSNYITKAKITKILQGKPCNL